MKRINIIRNVARAAFLLAGILPGAFAQDAFNYQGRLSSGTNAANGTYDFTFSLWDASSGPAQVGTTQTNMAVAVANGLFSVTLDFGSVFNGTSYWIEIGVRTNGGSAFTILTPRQPIMPTPYAITSENVDGYVNASQLVGTLPPVSLAGTYGDALNLINPANSFSGNGGGLTNVNALTLGGLGAGNFWRTVGNAGTTPGVNFLGTTDNNSLQIKVNNIIARRYDPTPYAPNVIAGLAAIKPTIVSSNVSGAVVGGGGAPSSPVTGYGAGDYFAVFDNDGTIGGGFGNKVGTDDGDPTDAAFASVGGGVFNSAASYGGTVAGGDSNYVEGERAAILGGLGNQALGSESVLGGGRLNTIETNAAFATLGGGGYNVASDAFTVVGGGSYNTIQGVSSNSTIGGGFANSVQATYATIPGGWGNQVTAGSTYSVVGGGAGNTNGAYDCTIAGGNHNSIQGGSHDSTIGGGYVNVIQANSDTGTIAGGAGNNIGAGALYSTIAGGLNSGIQANAIASTIGGGLQNQITASGSYSTIPGGYNNVAGGQYGTVGGGYGNTATNVGATVAGGMYNTASGIGAVVAGGGYDGAVSGNLASGNASVVGGGDVNVASGLEATVGGGEYNTASAPFSTVSGGNINTASGEEATVPGGYLNVAGGQFSYASGYNAQATNFGAFVWSDGTGTPTTSTNDNSVTFRASGGYRLLTGTGVTGAQLAPGATAWGTISDRHAKKNIEPVNCRAVLQKLAEVPIDQWNYKWEPDNAVPHIGPMAQDFKQAFYPGRDDKSITTLEFDGVELAAIQGLNQRLEEQVNAQAAEMKKKDAEVRSLEERLERLEKVMSGSSNTR